jgi:hypothetical protein
LDGRCEKTAGAFAEGAMNVIHYNSGKVHIEHSPDEYISALVEIFREVKRPWEVEVVMF